MLYCWCVARRPFAGKIAVRRNETRGPSLFTSTLAPSYSSLPLSLAPSLLLCCFSCGVSSVPCLSFVFPPLQRERWSSSMRDELFWNNIPTAWLYILKISFFFLWNLSNLLAFWFHHCFLNGRSFRYWLLRRNEPVFREACSQQKCVSMLLRDAITSTKSLFK